MRRSLAALCLALGLLSAAVAKPMADDLVDVPSDRLVTNLARRVAKDPGNAHLHYELARVHAIAYAQNTETLQVDRGSPEVIYRGRGGEDPPPPYRPPGPRDATARRHLEAALHEYKAAYGLDHDSLAYELGYGWCLDQAGRKQAAVDMYRNVYRQAYAKESKYKEWGVFQQCWACEAGRYLLALLDPEKDAAEIASIKAGIARLTSLPRPVTPILIPLDAEARFEDCVQQGLTVRYDLDGSGVQKSWPWISPRAGWLVYDGQNRKVAQSGLRLIGSRTFWVFWKDGYDALSALDDDGDGRLTGHELHGLSIWRDANGNGICDPGEVRPLRDWGITALSTHARTSPMGFPWSPQGVTFQDGSTRPSYDWITAPHQ